METALKLAKERQRHTIADIGTGCGAIAISLALELPKARIYATDLSAKALEVAASNCKRHNVEDRVVLLKGDLLEPLPGPVELIVANLPYVREKELAPGFEPALALDGGIGGTEKIIELCHQAKGRLSDKGSMLLEIGAGQAEAITDQLKSLFPGGAVEVFKDLSGIERVVSLSLSDIKVAR